MPRLPLLAVPLLADGVYVLASKWWSRRAGSSMPAEELEGPTAVQGEPLT